MVRRRTVREVRREGGGGVLGGTVCGATLAGCAIVLTARGSPVSTEAVAFGAACVAPWEVDLASTGSLPTLTTLRISACPGVRAVAVAKTAVGALWGCSLCQ